MTLRIKFRGLPKISRFLAKRWVLWLMATYVFSCGTGSLLFVYEYGKYQEIVNTRMSGPIFANTSRIYAAPKPVFLGESINAAAIATALRRAGYTDVKSNRIGWYETRELQISVVPLVLDDVSSDQDPETLEITRGGIGGRLLAQRHERRHRMNADLGL